GYTGCLEAVNVMILLVFLADFSWVFFVAIFVNLLGLGWPSWATHIYSASLVPISRPSRANAFD
ncbi:MAG: hypothetical protein WB787_07100, partial [Candidatus Acidiferrales bacterium]